MSRGWILDFEKLAQAVGGASKSEICRAAQHTGDSGGISVCPEAAFLLQKTSVFVLKAFT